MLSILYLTGGPKLWNNLYKEGKKAKTLYTFQKLLKSYLVLHNRYH